MLFYYLWNVDTRPEELQVLPHLLWFEFRVEDGQLSEHAHVSTLQPKSSLKHGDQLLKVTTVLKIQTQYHLISSNCMFDTRAWSRRPQLQCTW